MDFWEVEQSHPKRGKFVAISIVIVLHAAIIYALITGLAEKVVTLSIKPVFTKIVDEIQEPPPPPPPPPPPKIVKPEIKPPPPAFSAKSEVKNIPPPEHGITAVMEDKPDKNNLSTSTAQPQIGGQLSYIQPRMSANCKKPEYPHSSLRNGEQGITVVKLDINCDGKVTHAEVQKSSGFHELDKATMRAWSSCQFTPGIRDGQVIDSTLVIEYIWKIEP